MTEPLADLDRVPWSTLTDAYGSAEPIPGLLRRIAGADRDDARAALEELSARVCHQGQLDAAAPACVPFLVALLGDARTLDKHRLLRALRAFLAEAIVDLPGSPPVLVLDRPKDESPEAQTFRARYAAWLADTTRAVTEGHAVFRGLLAHADARVRAAAAYLLAPLREHAALAPAALREAIAVETDPDALASELCALGLAGRILGSTEDSGLFRDRLSSNDLRARSAAATALAWAAGASADEPVFAALTEGAMLPPVSVDRFPWHGGALAGLAAEALASLAERDAPRARRALIEALEARLARGDADPIEEAMPALDLAALLAGTMPLTPPPRPPPPEDEPVGDFAAKETVSAVAERLLRITFAGCEGRRDDELTWDELDEAQRAVVRALGTAALETSAIGLGLLVEGKDRARFAGLSPQGPLDEPLTVLGRTLPAWKWLRLVRRGQVAEAAFADSLRSQRTPAQILALCRDSLRGAYVSGSYDGVLWGELLPRLAAPSASAMGAALIAYADELLADPQGSPLACAFAWRLLARATGEVDPRFDPLLERALTGVTRALRDELLAALPEARRAAFR